MGQQGPGSPQSDTPMKAYLVTYPATVFGLLTAAHIWRVFAEGNAPWRRNLFSSASRSCPPRAGALGLAPSSGRRAK